MLEALARLARLYLTCPTRAAESSREPGGLRRAVWLYALFLAAYFAFYWLKPWDFPDAYATPPEGGAGLTFWLSVMLWQPPLEAAWIIFLLGFVAWFRQGSLPLRLVAGVAWTALPFLLIVAYAQKAGLPRWAFAGGSLASLTPFGWLLRRLDRGEASALAAFMLGLNVLMLALLAPMALAVLLRHEGLFKLAQIAGGLWILGAGTRGLRVLTGLRLPRAFMALLLSMFFQVALAFGLYLLGLVPASILKALLYG